MSGYIGTQPVPQATQTRDSFTATSGQTSFATGGYTPNFLDVYLNGVKLASADYTATNGSDVVLASGASTGDILEVVAFTTFNSASSSIDDNGNATAITIDINENVLVGQTTNALADTGHILDSTGTAYHIRDGASPLILNRKSSDGSIAEFYKDGTTVGSIATQGSRLSIGSGDVNLNFNASANSMYPISDPAAGTLSSGIVDLGAALATFKDAYLSGGVYLGGTGAANKLDDVETGTYVSNMRTQIGGNLSMGMNKFSYTKIGNLVHVGGRVNIANQSVSGRGGTIIIDWPFAHGAGSDHSHWSSITATTHGINFDTGAIHLFFETQAGNSYGTLYQQFDNTAWTYLNANVLKGDGSEWIYIQGSYLTN